MGYFDDYKLRISPNISNDMVKENKQMIADGFFNSPSYYPVSLYKGYAPYTSVPLDSWIVDDSKTKEIKQIQLIPDQILNFGDIIIWNNEYWLATSVDDMGGIYYRGSIQKCVSSLKWLDISGVLHEAWFIYRLDFFRGSGTEEGRVITLPAERRYIFIQNNQHTMRIERDRKFIFDGRVWKVTAIDRLLTGLIYLELEESDTDLTKDNMELRIADYYNKVSDYVVSILHIDISSIYVGNPYQIDVHVTNRGGIVSVPINFTSSDESVASINNNGLLTTHKKGEVTITATYGNASDVLTLNVLEQVVNNYSVDINGNPDIRYNATLTYGCLFKNNGFVFDDTSEYWLTGDDGISQTNLASITLQDNLKNTCSIKAAKVSGYIRLHVKNKNNLISANKRIQVKSPLEN